MKSDSTRRSAPLRRRATVAVLAAAFVAAPATGPAAVLGSASFAYADDSTQCTFPAKPFKGTPWPLQRVQLDRLWEESRGKGTTVAVIDTGVDTGNKQLKGAVDTRNGTNLLKPKKDKYGRTPPVGKPNGTTDTIGHGTKVAGIIAARPDKAYTGFVGIAPEATILPIKQNDENGSGNTGTMARAINYAVSKHVGVINISQDTDKALAPGGALESAVNRAVNAGIVVVASAGNDGLGGNVKKTYPAAYDGVLAVASSDRNGERAPFSQSGEFVGVAAPGVSVVSTVPKGGHCIDNGTSFSAPYVAGVAALLKAKYPKWTARNIVTRIEQTAERTIPGHDTHVGWGVIDPVRALTDDSPPAEKPTPSGGVQKAALPDVPPASVGETAEERNARLATYAVVGASIVVAVIAGTALVHRDWRRRLNGRRPRQD
ncbi:type VII secretion-associated serine protease mycosin [Streptomyces sp. NPDC050315]|uniref:type VII secretion-associated serine protease mycosin n=1 Tax=Streptomyces sp. NPDC050315 TaxID=3155039 RepID=UPI0034275F83